MAVETSTGVARQLGRHAVLADVDASTAPPHIRFTFRYRELKAHHLSRKESALDLRCQAVR
jgi:hypothetical protein